MTTGSANAAAATSNARRGVVPPPGQPLRTRQRRRGLVAAGVLLVLICGVLAGVLYTRAGGKVSVIVTARAVPVGHTIGSTDLTTAQVATDSIPAFAGSHLSEVIGKTAAVGLVAGEIVSPAMLSAGTALRTGLAVVGVAVKPGQLPADGLAGGDTVMVIVLSAAPPTAASGSVGVPSVLTDAAPVVDTATLPAGAGTVVSVQVPTADAAQLAAASSAGLVALVKVASA